MHLRTVSAYKQALKLGKEENLQYSFRVVLGNSERSMCKEYLCMKLLATTADKKLQKEQRSVQKNMFKLWGKKNFFSFSLPVFIKQKPFATECPITFKIFIARIFQAIFFLSASGDTL